MIRRRKRNWRKLTRVSSAKISRGGFFIVQFLFVLIVVPGTIIFSIFVAVTVFPKSQKLQSFFRGSFYLPIVTSGVVLSVVWAWIYEPAFGIANYVLSMFNFSSNIFPIVFNFSTSLLHKYILSSYMDPSQSIAPAKNSKTQHTF